MSSAPVNPCRARYAAWSPLLAARAACIGFECDPNTSRTPAAYVPAWPSAIFIAAASRPRMRPVPTAAPNTPAVPVMCHPMS